MELSELRTEIDQIDQDLLALFLRRMQLAGEVADYKAAHHLPTQNEQREQEILDTVAARSGALAPYSCQLYHTLFALSRSYQDQRRQGQTKEA